MIALYVLSRGDGIMIGGEEISGPAFTAALDRLERDLADSLPPAA
jgi:hypothetical protein